MLVRHFITVGIGAASLSVFGCEADNVRHVNKAGAGDDVVVAAASERQDDRTRIQRGDRTIDAGDDRTTRERSPDLPAAAVRVGDRKTLGDHPDTGLLFQATRDGRIYVYDADDGRVVVSSPMRSHEKFWLNATKEKAVIDGRTLYEGDLRRGHRYELYFLSK